MSYCIIVIGLHLLKKSTTLKKKGKQMQSQNLGKMKVNRKFTDNTYKKYKKDRRLQRQLKQTTQLNFQHWKMGK